MPVNKEILTNLVKEIEPEMVVVDKGDQFSITISKGNLIEIANLLKTNENTLFDMLIDVTAIDWMKKPNRYEVVYFLYSTKYCDRIRIKVPVEERKPHCPSVTSVWLSADWYERETYDMYGIIFDNHPFLRRFYMPEDFVDPETKVPLYPLRKDFPLMGIPDTLPLPPYPEKYGDVN